MSVQVFSVPVEERRYKEMAEQQFGDRGREQAKTCADIMAKTGRLIIITPTPTGFICTLAAR